MKRLKICSVLIMIMSLVLNGIIIWVCSIKDYYAFGFVFALTFLFLLLVFLYFLTNQSKEKSIAKTVGAILILLSVLGIVFHLTIFKENSGIPSDYYENPSSEISLLSGFMKEFSAENPMKSTNYLMFGWSFFSEIFADKHLVVSSPAVSNAGMSNILIEAEYTVEPIASIEKEKLEEWIAKYKPQELVFQKEEETRSLYLVTGSVWQDADRLYALDCQENTVIIPEEFILGTNISTSFIDDMEERATFEYEDVILNFHNDPIIVEMSQSQRDNYFPIRFKHFFFLLYLFAVGLICVYPHSAYFGGALSYALAFPIGVALYISVIVAVGLFRIPIVPFTVFGLPFIAAVGWHYVEAKKSKQRGCGLDLGGLIVCMLVVFVFLYFCFYPHVHMNYDSYRNVYIGKQIARLGQLTPLLTPLTSYSFVGPIINIGTAMLGLDYSFGFQPSFIAIGLVALYLLQVKLLKQICCKKYLSWIIPIITIALFITTPMYRISSVFVLNNASIGIWFGIAVSFFVMFFYSNQMVYFDYAFLPFVLFSFARIEGQVFAVIILVCLRNILNDKTLYRKLVLKIFTISLALYFLILSAIWDSYDPVFWSPLKSGAELFLLAALTAFVYIEDRLPKMKLIQKGCDNLEWVMVGVLFLAILALSPIRPEVTLGNIENMFYYLFNRGYWGIFWIAIFVFAVASLHYQNQKLSTFFLVTILGYGLATFVLMLFRTAPVHSGYGDSSCRMLLHITPAIGFFFSLVISDCLHVHLAEDLEKTKSEQVEPKGLKEKTEE